MMMMIIVMMTTALTTTASTTFSNRVSVYYAVEFGRADLRNGELRSVTALVLSLLLFDICEAQVSYAPASQQAKKRHCRR
jgi:hypothetical protein